MISYAGIFRSGEFLFDIAELRCQRFADMPSMTMSMLNFNFAYSFQIVYIYKTESLGMQEVDNIREACHFEII
jgi:hypothetical protein